MNTNNTNSNYIMNTSANTLMSTSANTLMSTINSIMNPNIYKGAGAIIYDNINNAIVIVKGNQQIYSFPKGHIKHTETMEECAVREIYEETGLKFDLEYIKQCKSIVIYEYIYYVIIISNGLITNEQFNFVDHREISSCNWYTIPEILTIFHQCNQGVKKIIMNWEYYKEFFKT